MFDPVTSQFIRDASPLPGLDPASLVDELTSAYVEIASARLAAAGAGEIGDRLIRLSERMSRIADTYEAQIILGIAPDRHRPMAFVAGSARQVLAQLNRLELGGETPTLLSEDVIGAELAASLLFLISQRSSDAYEASREIRAAGEPNAVRRGLILAVGRYARGQFQSILEMNDEDFQPDDSISATAADLLFRELYRGIKLLAAAGLGVSEKSAIDEALAKFSTVKSLAVETEIETIGTEGTPVQCTSIFAGPHHLAALLEKAGRSLLTDALIFTPPPTGTDAGRWNEWLQSEASRWPFLWENHRDAIATGYLEPGASLVMTTPTGSGKTTLAALKVASTLAAGKTVLYLAPTHALVGQVENDLTERVVGLAKAESIDQADIIEAVQKLPDIAVVTPERCFALLTFAPELFSEVGLLVFDEFHLLGATEAIDGKVDVDRRAIDAMLCLLTFQSINKSADFLLLSAMVSNGEEFAEWLESITTRKVIPFDYKWKPTRQLRAGVVYDTATLHQLHQAVNGNPPVKKPSAIPYGIFSLSSGWNPDAPDKILLRPFAPEPIELAVGSNRYGKYLTANRYQTAAHIAKSFAASGLKVVVFCESIVTCRSVAKNVNDANVNFDSQRDEYQEQLRKSALSEIGVESSLYDAGTQIAAVHHGELLADERKLVEGLFRRRDSDIRVLAATSTLAQGLNLPCDVVILAAMDRLDDSDPEEKSRKPLYPHEILNALGRAGRAGHAATGVSIVIPGSPIGCELATTKAVTSENVFKVVFAEGDQCLPILDPLSVLFDQIEVSGERTDQQEYLLRRLAISMGEERKGVETFDSLTRRSFGYFKRSKADKAGADAWLTSRREILSKAMAEEDAPESLPWQQELAAKTGASPAFIGKLAKALDTAPIDAVDAGDWVNWLLDQLDPLSAETEIFLRPETTIRVFGRALTTQADDVAQRSVALAGTKIAIEAWFAGQTLCEMEVKIAAFIAANEQNVKTPTPADKMAKHARRFALRLAPDLGFLCGVLGQVAQHVCEENAQPVPPMVTFLPQLIRLGHSSPYHYLIGKMLEAPSRPDVVAEFNEIAPKLDRKAEDDFEIVRQKLETIRVETAFNDIDMDAYAELFRTLTGKDNEDDQV